VRSGEGASEVVLACQMCLLVQGMVPSTPARTKVLPAERVPHHFVMQLCCLVSTLEALRRVGDSGKEGPVCDPAVSYV
jgi:hypothetical protein